LHDSLGTLAPDPILYADLENETVRKFGEFRLSKGVIRVGCDYFRKEMSADPFRLKAIKICAQSVLCSRRNEPDRELFKELRQELCAIISEADSRLKQYENGRGGHQWKNRFSQQPAMRTVGRL
jgi:hypothetical protein